MSDDTSHNRRSFLGTAAMTLAAGRARHDRLRGAQQRRTGALDPSIKPGTNTSFGPLKQIDAGVLNVGYAEAGPPTVPRSSFCTAGLTTFTAMSMSPRCWRRRATG